MSKRGGGIPMAERVSLGRGQASVSPARHCWVLDPADRSGVRRPGLLLEWRRAGTGDWTGRVVYAAELRPGEWAAVEEWISSSLLDAQDGPG